MEGQFLPSLRQLRTFVAVARSESISRASAQLHLSQSAVTQAIAGLEAKLDVPLFVRRSRGTYLTEYGKIFEKHTTRFFEIIEDAIRELGDETAPVPRMSTALTCFRMTTSQVRALIAIYEGAHSRGPRTNSGCRRRQCTARRGRSKPNCKRSYFKIPPWV
jgi:LysR family transcriptional regulator, regulator for genes of the gallate degradation pathway